MILYRVALSIGLLLAAAFGMPVAAAGPATSLQLASPVAKVVDGDTFDADLNGDGRIELPRERIRLMFVDTPELHDSPKGKDVAHAVPAQAALSELLQAQPVVLTVPSDRPRDSFGRTLARVSAGGVDVNLALVRQGQTPFDTRFGLPTDAEVFTTAEAEAFDQRLGIWKEAPSREHYLQRLRSEGRTPKSTQNPLYRTGVMPAGAAANFKMVGKYVTVQGKITSLRPVSSGALLVTLKAETGPALAVYVSRSAAQKAGASAWKVRDAIRAEGFVQIYRGGIQLQLHTAQAG